jgi:hypothetical protein
MYETCTIGRLNAAVVPGTVVQKVDPGLLSQYQAIEAKAQGVLVKYFPDPTEKQRRLQVYLSALDVLGRQVSPSNPLYDQVSILRSRLKQQIGAQATVIAQAKAKELTQPRVGVAPPPITLPGKEPAIYPRPPEVAPDTKVVPWGWKPDVPVTYAKPGEVTKIVAGGEVAPPPVVPPAAVAPPPAVPPEMITPVEAGFDIGRIVKSPVFWVLGGVGLLLLLK